MNCMDVSRVNKQIFIWSDQMANRNSKNHNFVVRKNFNHLGLGRYSETSMPFSLHTLIADITEKLMNFMSMNGRLVDLVMGELS